MNLMDEPIADAMGKEDKVGELSARRLISFTIDALRGIGEYRAPCASGVYVDQLVDTLHRIAISQRRDLPRFGPRSFSTDNMRNAIASANFGAYAYSHEIEDCVMLGDFRGNPRDQLEVYRPIALYPCRNHRWP